MDLKFYQSYLKTDIVNHGFLIKIMVFKEFIKAWIVAKDLLIIKKQKNRNYVKENVK